MKSFKELQEAAIVSQDIKDMPSGDANELRRSYYSFSDGMYEFLDLKASNYPKSIAKEIDKIQRELKKLDKIITLGKHL